MRNLSKKTKISLKKNQKNKKKESVEEKSPATEVKLTYSYNGNSVEETAHWIKSDNQAFGLYVLPTYELTAEEPE